MRKITILFLLFSYSIWAQEYNFLSKDYEEISSLKLQEYKQKDKDLILELFFENGEIVTKKFFDSIIENKFSHQFKQRFFRDSIQNKFATVLKKMSKEE